MSFAERCAWRAVYVYRHGSHLATLGIDPTADGGPKLFGALYFVSPRPWTRFERVRAVLFRATSFSVRLPHIRWRSGRSGLVRWAYQRQQALLWSLDGRKR